MAADRWHEVFASAGGKPRPHFARLIRKIRAQSSAELRVLEERMQAVLREMGVTFDLIRNDPWGRHPWTCDLVPHIFASSDWGRLVRGFRQRLHAFEAFLRDIYDHREILRANVIPHQVVLGSTSYQAAAKGLIRPLDSFLHMSGMCVRRNAQGEWQVKHHHFSHANGVSFMMQNRRALARVMPEIFQDTAVQSLAEMPLVVVERLRMTAMDLGDEPTVVLLSSGAADSSAGKHSFIARRMGISVVAGGDLLVLDDRVYVKTVRGLERVEVIYNRVADEWLDPLVFRHDSHLGVPGLVHCLRKGTVALINPIGAQLADDRSLLAFAPQIIRFYLGEMPILPSVSTYWLGDIDQREMVLEDPTAYHIHPIVRENADGSWEPDLRGDEATLRAEVRKQAGRYVAQPRDPGALSLCLEDGKLVDRNQDHILYAVRTGKEFEVFPGALTRVFQEEGSAGDFGSVGWMSKDSWVLTDEETIPLVPQLARRRPESGHPTRQVTSRVAEAFYWMGRYLERAHHQAYLISVIETLETEELNSAERRHYRPVWNRLLPPLEKSKGASRRSITTRLDRHRLLLGSEVGSVASTFLRAVNNAESVQDSLSPEAWSTMQNLRTRFQKTKFRADLSENEAARITRRLADYATQLIPQFFAVCANTMLADDAWRFCEVGQMLERALITANSVYAIRGALRPKSGGTLSQSSEIELSAFLRLLGCRDAYRRIFQMRAEGGAVLEMLWVHAEVPRSVAYCLRRCGVLLRDSIDPSMDSSAPTEIDRLLREIQRIDWRSFAAKMTDEDNVAMPVSKMERPPPDINPVLDLLLGQALAVHAHIADSFLNHQARISAGAQATLGF